MPQRFVDLREQVFALYRQGRFGEALEVVTRAMRDLPSREATFTFWQACFLCRLDQPDQALAVLEQASARGVWWGPHRLTGDSDLAPLRGRPAFDALVETSHARQELARVEARPKLEVVEGADTDLAPLLMAFHMRGSNLETTLPYWRTATRAGITVAVPQSSQLFGPNEYEWTDTELAEQEALQSFRRVQAGYYIDTSQVVLAGASQGAALATKLALQGSPIPARGFISVVGSERAETLALLLPGAAQRGVRGVLMTGEHDPARPSIEEVYRTLKEAGIEVRLEVIAGLGHDYPNDFELRLQAALAFVLTGA